MRPARRPAGWCPGGPQPAGDQGRADLRPGLNEDLCYLTGNFRVFQRQDGHRWSLDDLLTAWLAARLVPCPPARYLDMGSGVGSVLMMLAWKFPNALGVGIEAQDISVGLARRSLAYNGIDNRVTLHHADFRDPPAELQGQTFPLITGTPPYFVANAAVQSLKPQCGPCRFEWRGGVEAYCESAARWLCSTGVFLMVAAAEQTPRICAIAATLKLHRLHELVVIPKLGKAPLIAVHALAKTSLHASETETLIVRGEDDQWTPTFLNIREAMGLPGRIR